MQSKIGQRRVRCLPFPEPQKARSVRVQDQDPAAAAEGVGDIEPNAMISSVCTHPALRRRLGWSGASPVRDASALRLSRGPAIAMAPLALSSSRRRRREVENEKGRGILLRDGSLGHLCTMRASDADERLFCLPGPGPVTCHQLMSRRSGRRLPCPGARRSRGGGPPG